MTGDLQSTVGKLKGMTDVLPKKEQRRIQREVNVLHDNVRDVDRL